MDNLVNSLVNYIQIGNMPVLVLLMAFLGGVIASLSPCSLGMLPLIIAYVGGYSDQKSIRLFIQLLSFSFGVALILSIIGVICALTGKAFTGVASPIWILVLSSLIFVLGLSLIGLIEIPFPNFIKEMPKNNSNSLFFYPVIIGLAFGIAASPCSSPILAAIMAIASISSNILFSIELLFMFAFGQCIVVIIAGLSTSAIKNMKAMSQFSEYLLKFSGILLILVAFYLYYKIFIGFFI